MPGIGSLNEKPLHASLKDWYRRDGDESEAAVEGFVVDIVRAGLLIEIQTVSFSSMRRKLDHLLDTHRFRVVHPIPAVKWVVKLDEDGRAHTRRRSPKRGSAADLCRELVSFPTLLSHPNLVIEVLLTEEEEVWRPDPKGWRRSGFVIEERRLVDVLASSCFSSPRDLLAVLPPGLPDPFTTEDLARGLGRSRHLARQVAYCLRESGAIRPVRRERRGYVYEIGLPLPAR